MNQPISFFRTLDVPKGWGKEVQIVNYKPENLNHPFPTGYSGKLLCYDRTGAVSSMHFHGKKWETFYILSGSFLFKWIDPETADIQSRQLKPGETVQIPPLNNHQLTCLSAPAVVIEFASSDYHDDNYRVFKGDSQKK